MDLKGFWGPRRMGGVALGLQAALAAPAPAAPGAAHAAAHAAAPDPQQLLPQTEGMFPKIGGICSGCTLVSFGLFQ